MADELPPSFPPDPLNEADISRPSPKDPVRRPPEETEANAEDEESGAEENRSSIANPSVVEFVGVIAAALLLSVLIKAFLMQAYYVPSGSMEQTPSGKRSDRRESPSA